MALLDADRYEGAGGNPMPAHRDNLHLIRAPAIDRRNPWHGVAPFEEKVRFPGVVAIREWKRPGAKRRNADLPNNESHVDALRLQRGENAQVHRASGSHDAG